jgi:hypothetical protein
MEAPDASSQRWRAFYHAQTKLAHRIQKFTGIQRIQGRQTTELRHKDAWDTDASEVD